MSHSLSDHSVRVVFDFISVRPGSALAPYHFRKPTRMSLRLFGTFMPEKETDYHPSVECTCATWPSDVIPRLVPLLGSSDPKLILPRSTVTMVLLSRQSDGTKSPIGYSILGLRDVCDCPGTSVPFRLTMTFRGVSCGFMQGSVAVHGLADSEMSPTQAAASLAGDLAMGSFDVGGNDEDEDDTDEDQVEQVA